MLNEKVMAETMILLQSMSLSLLGLLSLILLGECIALWGEPNELSIQSHIYIFIQYVDS